MSLVDDDLEATRARRPDEAAPAPAVAADAVATRRRRLPDVAIDAAGVAVLTGIGLYGFQSSYGGVRYLVVGLVAMAAGIALGLLGARRRLPAIVLAATTVLLFVALSGAAQPRLAIAQVVPTPDTVVGSLRLAVFGWARLLSTRPPVGDAAGLQTIVVLCGLVSGVFGTSFARRSRSVTGAVAGPVAVLALGILFGTAEPVSLAVQGAVFAAVAVAWISARRSRERALVHGRSQQRQTVAGAVMLAAVATVGYLASSVVPFAQTNERFILRDRAVPPFDPLAYPSPLNGFHNYRADGAARGATYFRAENLPAGARLRLAVMDDYDGLVWVAAGSPSADQPASGNFERVGTEIPLGVGQRAPASGDDRAVVTIEVGPGYAAFENRVWVPGLGDAAGTGIVDAVAFGGDRRATLEDQFRFNKATGTGVVVGGLSEGDRIIVSAALPAEISPKQLVDARKGVPLDEIERPYYSEDLLKKMTLYLAGAADGTAPVGSEQPFAQIDMLRTALVKDGAYSDGGEGATVDVIPGHSVARLADFLGNRRGIVGNYEHYAATLALMARSLGIPARVVVGFVPKGSGNVDIHGSDAQAWVEVNLEGLGWVTVDTTPPEDQQLKDRAPVKRNVPNLDVQPPPPTSVPQADANAASQLDKQKDEEKKKDKDEKVTTRSRRSPLVMALAVGVGGPLILLSSFCGAVVVLKSRRRRRRRNHGSPARRVAGAWREVVDRAADLGTDLSGTGTRRELALAMATPAAFALASETDAAVFGPAEPSEETVDKVWARATETVAALREPVGVGRRLRAHVSVRSLRRGARTGRRPAPRGKATS